jgi:hypothetical protein
MTRDADRRLRAFRVCAVVAALSATQAFGNMSARAQSAPRPTPPVEAIGTTTEALDPGHGVGVYPLFTSADLHTGSATARQALVIIHGRLRNASDYYATALALTAAAGQAGEATIVVAPQFLDDIDVAVHGLTDNYLRWNRDWEQGAPAQKPAAAHAGDAPASSYDVLDDVVAKLSNRSVFPSLDKIVFVGHGGGAQVLARYAVVMHPQPGPAVSFVIANAGTYLYPTTARPVPLDCPDFNLWKYGLDNPPPYVGTSGEILKNFAARNVTLLLGADDRRTSGILDQSCAAKTQGRNRLDRGRNFARDMAESGIAPLLKYQIVAGAGHNEKKMLLSSEAREAIFAAGGGAR